MTKVLEVLERWTFETFILFWLHHFNFTHAPNEALAEEMDPASTLTVNNFKVIIPL